MCGIAKGGRGHAPYSKQFVAIMSYFPARGAYDGPQTPNRQGRGTRIPPISLPRRHLWRLERGPVSPAGPGPPRVLRRL